MPFVESDSPGVRILWATASASPPLQAPQHVAIAVEGVDANSAEWIGERRVIGGIGEYQGRDAERHRHYQCRNKTIAGDRADRGIDHVEEIADGPKK